MSAPEDALAEILAEHPVWERGPVRHTTQCAGCGQVSALREGVSSARIHAEHLAQVLAEWVAGEKARAWREGAITALDFAVRGDDGISLSLDLTAHPNPYKDQEADRG